MKRPSLIFAAILLGLFLTLPVAAQIETGIIIPGERTTEAVEGAIKGSVRDMAEYIGVVYNFMISVVGVLAGIMLMIGGFQYLTSGGDASRAQKGRERIVNAIAGVVLALSSFIILNTINPQLVNLRLPALPVVNVDQSLATWCETLIKDKTAVTPVRAGQTRCGDVGEYGAAGSGTYCVYYGGEPGTFRRDSLLSPPADQGLCMQGNDLSTKIKAVGDALKAGRAKPNILAVNISCAALAPENSALTSGLGYVGVSPGLCEKWNSTANPPGRQGNVFLHCGWSAEYRRCVFTPIECSVIKNDCTQYDVIQTWRYAQTAAREPQVQSSGLEKHKEAITEVCAWNPCKANQPRGCEPGGTIGNDCEARD